jgi:hypothetical protein
MLEQGISMLVNATISSPPFIGGFDVQLPKGAALPNWTYRNISDVPNTGLLFAKGLARRRLQIDVYGYAAADAFTMASTIDGILHGFAGILPDPGATFVSSCFRSDIEDYYDEASRTWRRMLEYEISFGEV